LVIKIENSRALMMYFSGVKDKERQMEIVYDVFLPDANFRKSNPGRPAVCFCVTRSVVAQVKF